MHIHDFRLNRRIRVLRVHQKINHLRAKINEIKWHHHVPGEKSSKIGYSLDQNNTVLEIFKFQLGLCSWRVFWFRNFKYQFQNIIKWKRMYYKPQAWLSWQVLWFV